MYLFVQRIFKFAKAYVNNPSIAPLMQKLIFGPITFAFSINTRLAAVMFHQANAATEAYAADISSPPLNAAWYVMAVKPRTPPTNPCATYVVFFVYPTP